MNKRKQSSERDGGSGPSGLTKGLDGKRKYSAEKGRKWRKDGETT